MSKTGESSGRGAISRVRRGAVVAALVVMAALLVAGLVGFFADPLRLPPEVLQVLDQRASVVSMFIGAVGLVIAVAALLLQLRSDRRQDTAAEPPVRLPPAAGTQTQLNMPATGGTVNAVQGGTLNIHNPATPAGGGQEPSP
ncbi:hypothetical protein AB0K40_12735 [Nonomuraea bangladeshensis]|uniref:Uncharacterized protein n=1 Tax=Nonomuraea bangladeshensis TaxID=404385 RepID=A0ABV3H2I8_9ACTN